jgi:uncharacterized protein YprB with RNaseH-like and TPR domain
VTIELARSGTHIADMAPDGSVRTHRLERLRDRRVASVGSASNAHAARRATPSRAVPAAVALARDVGGTVLSSAGGAIVVVERRTPLPADLRPLRDLPDPVDPDRPIVCLDTETTGLGTAAGTLPFLVALGRWQGPEMVIRQLLLPDHPDEPALLDVLERHLPTDAVLVTYNGRAFDWPLVANRYRLHGRRPPQVAEHLDLLPVARQLWRHRLADARLASVEAGIAGVRRHGDLPGSLIPEMYFDWLRRRDPSVFAAILDHNHQDVLSLALLLRILAEAVLPSRLGSGGVTVPPRDLMGLGRMYARRGRQQDALLCFETALGSLVLPWQQRELQIHLGRERARTLGRLGRRDEARSAWEAVALEGGPAAPHAWIQVAKWLEHGVRDIAGATRATRRAETLAARQRFVGQPQPGVERDVARRLARLGRLASVSRAPAPG